MHNVKITTFLWLAREDLNEETENEIIAAQDQTLQTNPYSIKRLQTERVNADYVYNLMRKETIVNQHAQYWQKQYKERYGGLMCSPSFNTCEETGVKLGYEHL
jgi:hypothetical protein